MLVRNPSVPVTCLLLAATFGAASTEQAAADAVFASFDIGDLGTGTLDGVGFDLTVTGGTLDSIGAGNFSGSAYDGSGSQSFVNYSAQTVTITFDQAVTDFSLYLYYFRGTGDTNFGADLYDFTENFTLNGNFEGGSHGTSLNVLSTPGFWVNGILSFTGPITSLSWTSYDQGGFEPEIRAVTGVGFTFAGTAGSAPAVPGPAGAAAMLGLAAAARRRRR